MNNTVRNIVLSNIKKDPIDKVKMAGGVLYMDARKATGYNLPSNSPLTNPIVNLLQDRTNYYNLVVNGNFINTNNWTSSFGTLGTSNNILSNTGSGTSISPLSYQTGVFLNINTHKVYIVAKARVTNPNCLSIDLKTELTSVYTVNNPVENQWYTLKVLRTVNSDNAALGVQHTYVDSATSNGKVLQIKEVLSVDLTAMFGAGLEPTLEQCEILFPFAETNGICNYRNSGILTNFAGTTDSGYNTTNSRKPFIKFDGVDDFIIPMNPLNLDITNAPLAIFSTIKIPDTISQTGYIFSKNNDSALTMQYGIFIETSSNSFVVYLEGNNPRININISAYVGKIVNIGFIWDGTDIRGYVNGALITTAAYSGTLTSRPNLYIGCRSNTGGTRSIFYNGGIGTLSVYTGTNCNDTNILKAERAIFKSFIG